MKEVHKFVVFILLLILGSFALPAFAQETTYQEAPMLAEMVAAGDLVPVDERLPVNPMVIEPIEQIGNYGGTLHRALTGASDNQGWRTIAYESLFEWGVGEAVAVPSLAASYEISEDGSVYTITLREGLKWSDGAPFTADDIVFFYEAVMLNDELSSALIWLNVAGEDTEIVKVDDLTVEFRFGGPYSLLPLSLCFNGDEIIIPKHYMSKYHPDFTTEEELQAEIEAAGVDNWTQLWLQKFDEFLNPDLPVMGPWKVDIAFPANQMVATRNPYYWKVDTEGNQLPYIDTVVSDLIEDQSTIMLRAAAGEIDFQYRHMGFGDVGLLLQNEEAGDYRVLRWADSTGWFTLIPNQTHEDPVLRELLQNVDFRAALSYALDRDTMNEILFLGTGEISHPVGIAGDPYFVDGYGQKYLEYDVDLANELLDGLGLTERDSEGYRLRSDGERLSLSISFRPFETGASAVDAYELVASYWEAVGIQAIIDFQERALWQEYVLTNQATIVGNTATSFMWALDPRWYVPTQVNTFWAPLYGTYYSSGGTAGEEPTEIMKQLQDLYDQLTVTIDPEENTAIGQEILRINNENLFMIGTVKVPFQPVVVSNNIVNALEDGLANFILAHEGQSKFYQLAFINPEE